MTKWGLSVEERLKMRLAPPDENGCTVYTGSRRHHGYGSIRMGGNGPVVATHRVAYEAAHGPIPEGMCVLHRCDNPPCCNPEHLFLGTQKENAADREAKGRGNQPTYTKCKAGLHDLDEHGYVYANGRRRCRPCGTAHKREWKRKRADL